MRAAVRNSAATPTQQTTPAPTQTPPPEEEALSGAESIQQAVSERSLPIGEFIQQLDVIGFTIGSTRFSLWTALVVVVTILVIVILARGGTKFSHWMLGKITRLDTTQRLLSEKMLSIVVWAMAIFIGIDILGIDLTALAVFSGALGLAIGFGLQKTFGNLFAGIILLMDRSIKPGDVIAIADQTGKSTFGQIRKIGTRAVSVTTRDRREYLIPNEQLMINQVENWSYSDKTVRIQVPVRVSYQCDLRLAESLMLKAAKDVKRILDAPPPAVWLDSYGESAVNFVIQCWIQDPEEGVGVVRSDVLKKLWWLFQDNGIRIPFPQHDLNLRDSEQFQQLVAAISQHAEDRRQDRADEVQDRS